MNANSRVAQSHGGRADVASALAEVGERRRLLPLLVLVVLGEAAGADEGEAGDREQVGEAGGEDRGAGGEGRDREPADRRARPPAARAGGRCPRARSRPAARPRGGAGAGSPCRRGRRTPRRRRSRTRRAPGARARSRRRSRARRPRARPRARRTSANSISGRRATRSATTPATRTNAIRPTLVALATIESWTGPPPISITSHAAPISHSPSPSSETVERREQQPRVAVAQRAQGGDRAHPAMMAARRPRAPVRPRRRAGGRAGATGRRASRPASTARRPPRRTRRGRASTRTGRGASESGSGSGARKWTVRSIVGAGASAFSRGHGAGNQASASTQSASASTSRSSSSPSQPPATPCSDRAPGRVAEPVLHRELAGERGRTLAGELVVELAPRLGRVGVGHRRALEERARPRDRVGAEREPDQLAVLLEPAADAGQRAPGALDARADPDRPGRRGAQEVHRHRARLARRVVDREPEAADHERHHVAAERPARRLPSGHDRRRPRRRRRRARARCRRRSSGRRRALGGRPCPAGRPRLRRRPRRGSAGGRGRRG